MHGLSLGGRYQACARSWVPPYGKVGTYRAKRVGIPAADGRKVHFTLTDATQYHFRGPCYDSQTKFNSQGGDEFVFYIRPREEFGLEGLAEVVLAVVVTAAVVVVEWERVVAAQASSMVQQGLAGPRKMVCLRAFHAARGRAVALLPLRGGAWEWEDLVGGGQKTLWRGQHGILPLAGGPRWQP
ncbi:uncharacterized protein EI90DRAFT_3040506 [Cantharellus anzutake]|uniref:uncharacterized protein n=1 Tax=Cantharellus anzutake TaxID=1750568 RepID=UPI001904CCF6|nr:uncharacterized protein EI90DRAFT_3040506 [Cantharellus anzutake]KAF8339128.1 hypothetical protein EI90DRAFT_3040506 [Cantharellus anzutake]